MARSDELRERWESRAVGVINQALAKGVVIDSPYGVIDGRMDLRGITLHEFIKGRTIKSCDFTAAERASFGQFGMSTLIDCIFRSATIDSNLGSRFERCVFDDAKMKGVVLRGSFVDCTFRGADLTSALGSGVSFERCVFDGATLKKAQLTASRSIDCSFMGARFGSGSLAFSSFTGSAPGEDQMGTTLMEGCSFA
jgi:uncharacterized protein YjbI with pentapeptide repeats